MHERTWIETDEDDGTVARTRPKRQSRTYRYRLVRVGDVWTWRDRPTWHVLAYARAALDAPVTARVLDEGQTRLGDYREMPFPTGSSGGLASTSAD